MEIKFLKITKSITTEAAENKLKVSYNPFNVAKRKLMLKLRRQKAFRKPAMSGDNISELHTSNFWTNQLVTCWNDLCRGKYPRTNSDLAISWDKRRIIFIYLLLSYCNF